MLVWQNDNYKIYKLNCFRCGCYILQYGSNNVLIDTSVRFERNKLIKSLKREGIDKINAIVLTHYHFDHVGNAAFLSNMFGCSVYASYENLEDIRNGRCNLPKGNSLTGKILYRLAKILPLRNMLRYEEVKEVLDIKLLMQSGLLGDNVKLISTKGHSKDGIAFIVDHKVAIVGDAFVRYAFMNKVSLPWADYPEEILNMWTSLYNEGCELYLQAHGAKTKPTMILKSINKLK